MKTTYKLLIACLLICGFSMLTISFSNAQCTTTFQYPSFSIALDGSHSMVPITDCQFDGDYSIIDNAVSGETYAIYTSNPDGEVTVHSGSNSGPVIAFGATPFTFVNTFTGTIYLDWTSTGCALINTSCSNTGIQCMSCPGYD